MIKPARPDAGVDATQRELNAWHAQREARLEAQNRAARIQAAERAVLALARLWAPRSPVITPEDEDCERDLRYAVRALEAAEGGE